MQVKHRWLQPKRTLLGELLSISKATYTNAATVPPQIKDHTEAVASLLAALKQCRNLEEGKKLHWEALESDSHTNKYIATALIRMYSKCGSMLQARSVFDSMPHWNVVSWNSLLMGYVENGQSLLAMELFGRINCEPSALTFLSALKACASLASEKQMDRQLCLEKGIAIHTQAKERGLDGDTFVANTLVDMYSKSGSMRHAREVFDNMSSRDAVSWTSLIQGYVENGECLIALDLFMSMDCEPSSITVVAALKACTDLASSERLFSLEKGMIIHKQARELGLHEDIFVESTLVDMYSKCGSMVQARAVFDRMSYRTFVSWNNLLLGYVENGESLVAMELFTSMDCEPSSVTFVAALKACTRLGTESSINRESCLEKGMAIHNHSKECGYDSNVIVASTLVDMYSKCGSILHARAVFDNMVQRTAVSWNSLILGYVENGESLLALEVFNNMDYEPDSVTFVGAIKACTSLSSESDNRHFCLEKGMGIHRRARECGFETDAFVASNLVDMYRKCRSTLDARSVFDRMVYWNVVSFTSLILGYVENGESLVAMDLFSSVDCEPDSLIYVAAFKACAGAASEKSLDKQSCLEKGMEVHTEAKEHGYDTDVFVANTLLDMYSKCGSMLDGRGVFDRMPYWTTSSVNILLLGYVENGESELAVDLFLSMASGYDTVTFVAALRACGTIAELAIGQGIHGLICKLGLEQDHLIQNCLVDFYGKCGSMDAALHLFDMMHSRDIVSWSALVSGYSSRGETSKVFSLVTEMDREGVVMDGITMVSVLTACNHTGMVEEGKKYFQSMSKYGITPTMEHYSCMVDMLGRANKLQEATGFLKSMPFEADFVVWTTLVTAYCSSKRQ